MSVCCSPGRTDHLLHMVISVKTLTLVLPLCSLISLMKKFKVAPQDVVEVIYDIDG